MGTFEAILNKKVDAGELNSQQIAAATAAGLYDPANFITLWKSQPIPERSDRRPRRLAGGVQAASDCWLPFAEFRGTVARRTQTSDVEGRDRLRRRPGFELRRDSRSRENARYRPRETLGTSYAAMDEPLLDVRDLSMLWPSAERPVLRNVSLRVRSGEFVAILGANGSGKRPFSNASFGSSRRSRGRSSLPDNRWPDLPAPACSAPAGRSH